MKNEKCGLRFEEKIDPLQSEIRMLTDCITRHIFVNDSKNTRSLIGSGFLMSKIGGGMSDQKSAAVEMAARPEA